MEVLFYVLADDAYFYIDGKRYQKVRRGRIKTQNPDCNAYSFSDHEYVIVDNMQMIMVYGCKDVKTNLQKNCEPIIVTGRGNGKTLQTLIQSLKYYGFTDAEIIEILETARM